MGFKPGHIYEFIYPAKNPLVLGLGFAVTRDLISFLRYESKDAAGKPNPLASSKKSTGIITLMPGDARRVDVIFETSSITASTKTSRTEKFSTPSRPMSRAAAACI